MQAPDGGSGDGSDGGSGAMDRDRPKRRRGRGCLAALAALIAVPLLLWLLRAPLLSAAGGFLHVQDPLRRADVIYVLGGDADVRPFLAARLYRAGWAPRIAIPRVEAGRAARMGLRPTLTDVTRAVLRREGVPDSAIVVLGSPGGSASTADDAALLAGWVRLSRARTVIAVTTEYHTRRSRWHLRRALDGTGATLVVRGAADPHFDERSWWKSEGGLVTYANEYLRFAHNLFAR